VTAFWIKGIVFGLSAGFSPGPLLALVISQTLRHGLLTDLPIIVLTVFVLTRLAGFRGVLGAVTLAGAVFVLFLAYENLRIRGFEGGRQPEGPQSLSRGVLVNALSPHPYLFWLTVGAPAIVQAWGEHAAAAAGFLAGFYVCLVGSKMFLAALVSRSRQFFIGRAYVYAMRILGAILLVFSFLLFRDALRYLSILP
jgi:threonine/homoserine/homoserine lactone efflux protein